MVYPRKAYFKQSKIIIFKHFCINNFGFCFSFWHSNNYRKFHLKFLLFTFRWLLFETQVNKLDLNQNEVQLRSKLKGLKSFEKGEKQRDFFTEILATFEVVERAISPGFIVINGRISR